MTLRRSVIGLFSSLILMGCQPYSYKERGVPDQVELSPRLQALFASTKQVCFGRYVLEVPAEARLIFGTTDFPAKIITHVGAAKQVEDFAEAYRNKELEKDETAEITYFGSGPIRNSWEIRSFEDDTAKQYRLEGHYTFAVAGEHLFEWASGGPRLAPLVSGLRARDNTEIPTDPGVCIDHGFIADSSGTFQEIFQAGIALPSLPDVSFSVDANKTASVTDGNGEGLLAGISAQRRLLGALYPELATLREGKRNVGVWKGEESLVRRKDGTHEFEWEAVGKERSTLHPAWINAKMFSKVAADRIGAADKASLTDDEAIALWDKLLDGVRFRVNAPPTQTGEAGT
ncbi:T6SS immunity protein Tli4 family protein [Cupriavidus campinensis]